MTVRLAKEGMELDPGGIGKGFAVDNMVELLKQREVYSALIVAGGSTIYGLGTPRLTSPDGKSPSKIRASHPE